ncbi:chromosome segregation in meiosis- protein [Coniosporium apollinis]|uniref:Chromosome segregation in meiosis protein n=1 Tax=Coniosporium apollinis TaxID=61459 RepID=A0ABQ9P3E6_9PEZI|nr:chromosome segregation in meiosis- protein [Coniosporium apollinis]
MPSRVSPPPAQGDELDDLFNYDAGMDDVFKDLDGTKKGNSRQEEKNSRTVTSNAAGLGIDEEIKVAKKRQPVAKLDDARLLSAAGIPKLRRISKQRLKFKGTGHEFSDMARLLNTYQLWLDDLYPRAKFADGLAIIEKLGHTKRMQMMRKEWIYENKPKPSVEDDPVVEPTAPQHQDGEGSAAGQNVEAEETQTEHTQEMAESGGQEAPVGAGPGDSTGQEGGALEEDELDALLAEDAMQDERHQDSLFGSGPATKPSSAMPRPHADDYEDDLEAMADLDW